MVARLFVAAAEVVGPRKLKPYPGQPGPKRKNFLESLRRRSWHANPHLHQTEQKELLNPLFLAGRPRLLKE